MTNTTKNEKLLPLPCMSMMDYLHIVPPVPFFFFFFFYGGGAGSQKCVSYQGNYILYAEMDFTELGTI